MSGVIEKFILFARTVIFDDRATGAGGKTVIVISAFVEVPLGPLALNTIVSVPTKPADGV